MGWQQDIGTYDGFRVKVQILYHCLPASAASAEHRNEIDGIFNHQGHEQPDPEVLEAHGDAYAQYRRTISDWRADANSNFNDAEMRSSNGKSWSSDTTTVSRTA